MRIITTIFIILISATMAMGFGWGGGSGGLSPVGGGSGGLSPVGNGSGLTGITAGQVGALPTAAAGVCVNVTGSLIRTAWKYSDTTDMWLNFNSISGTAPRAGYNPNNITMIDGWSFKPNSGPISADDLSTGGITIDQAVSDSADGPMVVVGTTRPYAGGLADFTGGNHATAHATGAQVGAPTARQMSVTVKIDGNTISSGTACGQRIDIAVVNNIQADNTMNRGGTPGQGAGTDYSDDTGGEVIQESVHYTVTGGGNVTVDTTLTALEAVTLKTYYGIMGPVRTQLSGSPITLFYDNASSLVPYTYTINSTTNNSGVKSSYPSAWRYSVRGSILDYVGWFDLATGLGAAANVDAASPLLSTNTANKVYANLVTSAAPLTLAANATATWRGGYRFTPHTQQGNTADIIPASAASGFEPAITTGTTLQYLKGNKGLGTLNQAAVAGLTTASSPQFLKLNTISTTQYVSGLTAQYSYADNNGVAIQGNKSGKTAGISSDMPVSGAGLLSITAAGYDGSTYGGGASIVSYAKENFSSSSYGADWEINVVPYGVSSTTQQMGMQISRDSTTDTIISLGTVASNTATLQTTSNATKGLLTIPNAVSITGTVTAGLGSTSEYYCDAGVSAGNLCRGNGCSCVGGAWQLTGYVLK